MVKVGITGQNGFVGSHLKNYLKLQQDIDVITFRRNYFSSESDMDKFVSQCDVIVHTAALNRHKDLEVLYKVNVDLVKSLISSCQRTNSTPKILFTSSIQEERDNLYGKSKKEGRNLLEKWSETSGGKISSLVIPNVYGPFGKPFYNSVVATFCHQLVHDEIPVINTDSELNLIYVNELCEVIYNEILKKESEVKRIEIPHTATIKVSELLEKLKQFKASYFVKGAIPNLTEKFELDLFNTFRSFLPKEIFPRKFTLHTDNRGSFVEVVRTDASGQFSYSTTKPGITRGNHYHTRKVERFAVIKGKALIQLRKIDTDQVIDYYLNGEEPSYVDMPIWHTHNIKNIGEDELVTLFWINEPYDPENPDTYFETV